MKVFRRVPQMFCTEQKSSLLSAGLSEEKKTSPGRRRSSTYEAGHKIGPGQVIVCAKPARFGCPAWERKCSSAAGPAILRCSTSHKSPATPTAICFPSRRTSWTVPPMAALRGGSAVRSRNGDFTTARWSMCPTTRVLTASTYTVTSGNSGLEVLARRGARIGAAYVTSIPNRC